MYFDALKNGCKVASLQLRMLPRLEVVLALFMIVAWRINPAIILTALTVVVDRLPKTRSDKVLRATMIQLASGEDYKGPPSIDDPEILSELARSLDPMGYPIH